jgi:peptidoglycan/xylan/chitin deacetylase (PgdA/CDA1 family)
VNDAVGVVPVLLFHSLSRGRPTNRWQVTADDFKRDMEAVVASGRTTLTAQQYGLALRHYQPVASSVLITFDDGFADYADVALPILESFGLVATLFVTTGWLGRPGMLSVAAVRDLATSAGEIGSHSVSHPHLDIVRHARARYELERSKADLEETIGRSVTSFAYPHGSYRAITRQLVAASGYRDAHAVKNALSHSHDDFLSVGRFTVEADTARVRVSSVLGGRSLPLAWQRERMRTSLFRLVRYSRSHVTPSCQRPTRISVTS